MQSVYDMYLHSCITVRRCCFSALVFVSLMLFGLPSTTSAQQQDSPSPKVRLIVTVTGIRNDKGSVSASLFDQEKGFPDDDTRAISHRLSAIEGSTATLVFDGVAPGSYSVVLLHDENKNNKMDFNRFGFPREGYGFLIIRARHGRAPSSATLASSCLRLVKSKVSP